MVELQMAKIHPVHSQFRDLDRNGTGVLDSRELLSCEVHFCLMHEINHLHKGVM